MTILKQNIFKVLITTLLLNQVHNICAQKFYDFENSTFKEYGIIGDTSLYLIDNGYLRLNGSTGNSPARLFIKSDVVTKATWQFRIEMDFNPSSSNYAEIYLICEIDSSFHINKGYFLTIGGSEDDIKLYKEHEGKKTTLIDGLDKLLDLSNVLLDVKVTRDSLGKWDLYTMLEPASEFTHEGTAIDNQILISSFWGLSSNFTSTRADKFRFDNVLIQGIPYPDVFAPEIDSLFVTEPDILTISFNEKVILSPGSFQILRPQSIRSDSIWPVADNIYSIHFESEFLNGYIHQLLINEISDENRNTLSPDTLAFLYYQHKEPAWRDIVINEIFADPNPSEDLPDGEFVEIWNRSSNPQNLEGWKLSDNRSEAILEYCILHPDSLIILTSKANASKYHDFGRVLPLNNWPSLNNDSDVLILKDSTDKNIDSLRYDVSSHDPEKSQGGWTLELVNPDNPCMLRTNWTSSVNPIGGTPGQTNSVFDNTPDTIPPSILDILSINPELIRVEFSEAIIPNEASIYINSTPVKSLISEDNNFTNWIISTEMLLESNVDYQLYFDHINDCFENELSTKEYSVNFDFDPPEIDSVYIIYHNQMDLFFNEEIDISILSIEFLGIEAETSFLLDNSNGKHLILTLDSMLIQPFELILSINNLSDIKGNFIHHKEVSINYQPPEVPGIDDLIISEFLSDPVPSAGLPEIEFIEIRNVSNKSFPLRGVRLRDPNKEGKILNGLIHPGDYYILCPESSRELFERFGNVAGVSNWPNLNSSSDSISLINQSNQEIFSLAYSKNWFTDDEKADGGWSIELKDDRILCHGSIAWGESYSLTGGTPGQENSYTEFIPPPATLDSWIIQNEDTILLTFSRKMDILNIENVTISVNSQTMDASIFPVDYSGRLVGLTHFAQLVNDSIQNISISGLKDCSGLDTYVEFEYYRDVSSPEIIGYDLRYSNQLELLFNKEIVISNVQVILNEKPLDSIQFVFPELGRRDTISLLFTSIENRSANVLQLIGISDRSGNRSDLVLEFNYEAPYIASQHDLIITEIMANPLDQWEINFEFVEIYNPTEFKIPLNNYSLSDMSTKGSIGFDSIEPGSYAVLIPDSYKQDQEGNFKAIKVKPWPQLNKSGDRIILENIYGEIIHKVEYEDSWYQSTLKKEGGWSLEMIDNNNPCGESGNWIASENVNGGTPGNINSVKASKPDLKGPEVLAVFIESRDSIKIYFNEKLMPQSIHKENIRLSPSIIIEDISLTHNEKCIEIKLEEPVLPSIVYQLSIEGISDCNGNILPDSQEQQSLVYPEAPKNNNLIINEILFNPRPGGVDFIELYNVSDKYLKLDGIKISNGKDTIKIILPIIVEPFDYVVLTEEPDRILNEYPKSGADKLFRQQLPTMPDSGGLLEILDSEDLILDELAYSEKMHFELYTDLDGISIERISPFEPSGNNSNWTSASSLSEGATPGYKNSQFLELSPIEKPISISPKVFDPNSGNTPFTTIQFAFDQPGYVASLEIYDLQGRLVKQLLDNDYLPQTGFINWEGNYELGGRVQSGPYIVFFSVFDLNGRVKAYKERVVVGTRF